MNMSGLKLSFEKKWHCQIASGGYKSFKNVKFFACGGPTSVATKSGPGPLAPHCAAGGFAF